MFCFSLWVEGGWEKLRTCRFKIVRCQHTWTTKIIYLSCAAWNYNTLKLAPFRGKIFVFPLFLLYFRLFLLPMVVPSPTTLLKKVKMIIRPETLKIFNVSTKAPYRLFFLFSYLAVNWTQIPVTNCQTSSTIPLVFLTAPLPIRFLGTLLDQGCSLGRR